ncbi:MAG: glucosaminidase domain-containing protein, partial [Bacteroidota bacterium]
PQNFMEVQFILKKNWLRIVLIGFIGFLMVRKDLSFSISMGNAVTQQVAGALPHSTGLVDNTPPSQPDLFMDPAFLGDQNSSAEQKKERCKAYIERFSKTAQSEMEQFGIPASITLAQGLLESNAGKSKLAVQNNNHFGMKCFSKKCTKGHCSNFEDDHHKDFFRIYGSSWESFRAHSTLLQGKRYRHLRNLGTRDYVSWATGLQKAGYATDKRYAKKLIRLIESFNLQQYDY